MNWFTKILKVLGPRVIGAGVSAVGGIIYAKTKGTVQVDTTQVAEIVTGMIITYATAHRGASALINPGDAATGRVAEGIDKAANDPRASDAVVIPPKQ